MPGIENTGWELFIRRIEEQSKSGAPKRTYGEYQVFIDGKPVDGLSGNICEREGPGDNKKSGDTNNRRIEEGRYPISTHFGGKYKSIDFKAGEEHSMPGFLLKDTNKRTFILVHPGHSPTLFISSVGCLNPTKALGKKEDMTFNDSRARVIAMLESLKKHDPKAFEKKEPTAIKNAAVVIDGEP